MSKVKIIIWDIDNKQKLELLKKKSDTVIMWNGYKDDISNKFVSILNLIEKNAHNYRKKYLNWVYSLNNIKYKNKKLIDHFEIRPNFSFWSMSLFNEKCNFVKSPEINDAIKLIAFEEWKKNINVVHIELYSSNKYLLEILKDWCLQNNVLFKGHEHKIKNYDKKIDLQHIIFKKLPKIFQSIIWLLFYLKNRWSLRGAGINEWINSNSKITFVSYLVNLNYKKLNKGDYESHFWGSLPDKLKFNGIKTNWLHLWTESNNLKTSKDVINSLHKINDKYMNDQVHVTIDSFLSIKIILKVIYDWIIVIIKSNQIRKEFFKNQRKGFNLTIIQKLDWSNSIYGVEGIKNILFYNLLDCAFKNLKNQTSCFYLQENQGWEFGLLYSWKKNQNKLIFGVPHFSIRFWDLRYYFDEEYFKTNSVNSNLRPYKVLVNGPIARKNMLDIQYPKHELIDVEALRYNYLHSLIKTDKEELNLIKKHKEIRILVIGDYDVSITNNQLSDLKKSIEKIGVNLNIYLKPHPASNMNNIIVNKLKLHFVHDKLSNILEYIDIALCGSSSSAAVDVYYYGLPMAIHINQKTLNLSPLKNICNEVFYSNHHELKKIILDNYNSSGNKIKKINFFNLDDKIPRWLTFFDSLKQ